MKPLPAILLLVVLAMVFVAMVSGGFHRDQLEEGGNSDSGSPDRSSSTERQGPVPSKASTRVVGASSEFQPKDPISVHVKDFRAARSRFEGRERYERTLDSFKMARANLSGVQLIRFVNEVEDECPEELREWLSNSVSQKVMAMPEDRKDVGDFLENNGISKRLAFSIGIEAGASKYEVSSRYANAIKEKDSRREFMVGYQMMFYRFDPVAAVENIVDYAESFEDPGALERFVKIEPLNFDWDNYLELIGASKIGDIEVLNRIEGLRKKHDPVLRD